LAEDRVKWLHLQFPLYEDPNWEYEFFRAAAVHAKPQRAKKKRWRLKGFTSYFFPNNSLRSLLLSAFA
jgi:hypothetical protein